MISKYIALSLLFPDQHQIYRKMVAVTARIGASGKGTQRISRIGPVFLNQELLIVNPGFVKPPSIGSVEHRLRNDDLVEQVPGIALSE